MTSAACRTSQAAPFSLEIQGILGAEVLTLVLAGLGIGGTLAVVGFLQLAMRLGHETRSLQFFSSREGIKKQQPPPLLVEDAFSLESVFPKLPFRPRCAKRPEG